MKILVIQHVHFENPGYFARIFEHYGAEISYINVYQDQPEYLPDFQVLLVMGGPMNIYEEEKFPWLKYEKKLIKKAIDNARVVIGICLGAQLIADALGSNIYRAAGREIGWFPVQKTTREILQFLPEFATVFHWHGETFDLPPNSVQLYKSDIVENQAFLYDNRVLGLQFHLEMTEKGSSLLCDNCRDEMDGTRYVMNEKEIIKGFDKYSVSNRRILRNIIKWLFEKNGLLHKK